MKKFFYRVEKGDTVFLIASKFKISVTGLIAKNNLKEQVSEGDLLVIERCNYYRCAPFDTIDSITERFKIDKEEFFSKNKIPYVYFGLTVEI